MKRKSMLAVLMVAALLLSSLSTAFAAVAPTHSKHDWGPRSEEYPATCTEHGMEKATCEVCHETKYWYTDPLGHDWGDWHVVTPAEVGQEGLEQRECNRCGLVENRVLPPLEEFDRNPGCWLELVSATQPQKQGDVVHSVWKLTNTGNVEACFNGFAFKDAHDDWPGYISYVENEGTGSFNCIDGGQYLLYEIDFEVTADDAASGSVYRTLQEFGSLAYANPNDSEFAYNDDDPIYSNVAVLELPLLPDTGMLTVTKSIIDLPNDPNGFAENEVIHYLITATNDTPFYFNQTVVFDSLYNWQIPLTDLGPMAPGETLSCTFDYTVTPWDVAMGLKLLNTALVEGHFDPDNIIIGSAEVECPLIPSERTVSALLEKEVMNLPSRGYYEPGEEITYYITLTNTGSTAFLTADIYDSQVSGCLDTFPMMQPGDSYTTPHRYTTIEADLGTEIYNTAFATVYTMDGIAFPVTSNTVKSPVGREIFDDDHDEFTPPVSGEDSCVRTLVECGDAGYTYELHFCGTHSPIQKNVRVMIPANAAPDVEASAWEYAAAFWKEAAEQLYTELRTSAKGTIPTALMEEQLTFTVLTENMAAALEKMMPDHPEKAAYQIARLWENKVVDLCWLIHHGSEARPDLLKDASALCTASADCGITVLESEDAREVYQVSLCDGHVSTDTLCKTMVQSSGYSVWSIGAGLWQCEASKLFDGLWKNADSEGKPLVRAAAATFNTWLSAQRALYSSVYDAAVAEEITARTAMELVSTLCAEN